MRALPVGDLICPEPECRAELTTVERQTGTRFLRNRKGTSDCGHAFGRGQGGGPPSAEHRWFQQRLAMLCDILGYDAIQEHLHADVWVASTPQLAIEVQRWATDIPGRSAARQAKGANVLWLLPESAKSQKLGTELFRQPAARIRVFHRDDRTKEARPWEPGHSGPVLLSVGATVMRLSPDGRSLVSAGSYDAKKFLREVLEGERRWYGPREPGFKFGAGWALTSEVERLRARRAAQQPARVLPPVARAEHPAATVNATPPETPPSMQDEPTIETPSVEVPLHNGPQTTVGSAGSEVNPDGALFTPSRGESWLRRLRKWFFQGGDAK